ncbi:MAG: LLM class flavin-dependent oxidoreductase [Chloroflexi bacterium]|nr:LLM class flavin-dependent oxidoreductase [Chloroflexota bacterium]
MLERPDVRHRSRARWDASWANNLALARLADEIGLEALVPIARWKGYGGDSNPNGSSFESITWACGLLGATRRIGVFATIHVPLIHPLVAAKQLATVDHIGQGRLGINVVCGWNEDEFQMFGVQKKEHDDRYEQGDEWWRIVTRIWAGKGPFDFAGVHYQLAGVVGQPSPWQRRALLMMNAGSSPAGRDFAVRNSDMHFDGVTKPEGSIERIAETKRMARERGRHIEVWTPVGIVCRATQREADDFTRYVVEHADVGAVGHLAELHASDARSRTDTEGMYRRLGEGPIERQVIARGNYCAIGDPDRVANELARLHGVGFDGLALNFVNYLDELPFFAQEVLPRLQRQGLSRYPRT